MKYEKRPYTESASKVKPLDETQAPLMTPEQIAGADKHSAKQISKYPSSLNFEDGERLPLPSEVEEAKQEMALDFLRRAISPYFSQKEISLIINATSNYRHSNGLFENRTEANKPAREALNKIDEIFNGAYNLSQKDGSIELASENKTVFITNVSNYLSESEIAILRQTINDYQGYGQEQSLIPNLKSKLEF